ncbi:hypothetical protein FA95DRAFT_1505991 [Auriscalpium vulgare]|uniref:Uncharacterized protein n=1 Tax=Auriscalpium vulgare TaxID=40419 RepID=A0ACB8R236_9AGAM|nr:hypothetical protein FA95DRAFT_1505991 [Auriscalpium vulgare]
MTPAEEEVLFDYPTPPFAQDILNEASPHWFWRIILLLTSWLHVHYHLPHLGCILLLKTLRLIFVALGALQREDRVPETLSTSFRRLGLVDEFAIHPVCEKCHRIFPPDTSIHARCSHCDQPLFNISSEPSVTSAAPKSKTPPKARAAPKLQCPQNPLSNSLVRFLWQEDNEKLCDEWRRREQVPNKKMCIQDGEIWNTLPGPDGKPFFDNSDDRTCKEELRIGITLGFDGFGYERSQQSGSHSSGVLSSAIANLPTHLKYRPRNLHLYGLTPGPKEFTADELQLFMANYVTNLLKLYDEGIFIKTPLIAGRRIRVALVAVCCDHPAMCRVCGFGDHRKEEGFCSRCHITHADLRTRAGVTINGFEPRSGQEHRMHAATYAELAGDPKAQDAFFKERSARYFELSRLPYFDPVRMTVFDPMHNILLGIVKTHWYNGWVQTKALRERTPKVARELDQIHNYLRAFEMPSWVARLPQQVGYPAGGSLSADEWKGMATVYGPIVIPFIWDEWYPAAVAENIKKREAWRKREDARIRRIASGKARDGDDVPEPEPQQRMLHGDDDNFLKLAAFLKLVFGRTIWDTDIPHARELLQDYLYGFFERHPDVVKPNHHWVTHIFDQLRDYGPVYGFWTFIFERLNKVLKSYSTNNHGGGEIEVTFMRAFMRDATLRQMKSSGELSTEDECLLDAIKLILASDGDSRGTVAALAQEAEGTINDCMFCFTNACPHNCTNFATASKYAPAFRQALMYSE